MPKSDQGVTHDRYQVIPRTLIFIFQKNRVLLLKGSPTKRIWANHYNGIGGHVEQGEGILAAARRELFEEAGLVIPNLWLCGIVMVDASDGTGICLYVMRGDFTSGTVQGSEEGKLEWVSLDQMGALPLVDDLKILIPRVQTLSRTSAPFSARSFYDENDQLVLSFDEETS